jgi:hypothetical protein
VTQESQQSRQSTRTNNTPRITPSAECSCDEQQQNSSNNQGKSSPTHQWSLPASSRTKEPVSTLHEELPAAAKKKARAPNCAGTARGRLIRDTDGLLAIAEKLMERTTDAGYDVMGKPLLTPADVQKLFQHVVEAAHMEGAAAEASRREVEMAELRRAAAEN